MTRRPILVLVAFLAADLSAGVPFWDVKGRLEAPDKKISVDTTGRYWGDTSLSDDPDVQVAVDLDGERWENVGVLAEPDRRISLDFKGRYWHSDGDHEKPNVRISLDFNGKHWQDIGTARPDHRIAMRVDDGWSDRQVSWGLKKEHWAGEGAGIHAGPDRRISFDMAAAKWNVTGVHEGPDLRISLDMTGKHWNDQNVSDRPDLRLSISYDRNGTVTDARRIVMMWLTQTNEL